MGKRYVHGSLPGSGSCKTNPQPQCTRPLIFICHSYGGLVVAQSLVEANSQQRREPYLKDLLKATYGIFFFGTPHRGMVKDDLLAACEATGVIQPRENLIKSIDKNCASLKENLRRFVDLCDSIKICTFTETRAAGRVEVVRFVHAPRLRIRIS